MKKMILLFAMVASCLTSSAVNVASWDYAVDLGAGYSSGWLVQLYQDVNSDSSLSSLVFDTLAADGTFTSTGNGSDDILLGVTTTLALSKGGVPPLTWSISNVDPGAAGIKVYSVIFNNNNIGAATLGRIVDSSAWTVVVEGTYTQSSVNGSWQAVPEPATALLFGIGGMGAWMVRRNKLKSKEIDA